MSLLNGRDFYQALYGTPASKAAYDRIVGEWIAGGRMVTEDPGRVSLAWLMVVYVKHRGQHDKKFGKPTIKVFGINAALRFLKSYTQEPADTCGPLAL